MRYRVLAVLAATAACAGTLVTVGSDAASAAPGAGSFTRITTPADDLYMSIGIPVSDNTFQVVGQTSPDVTAVNIDCVYTINGRAHADTFAANVPAPGGTFVATARYPQVSASCRLRAIPTTLPSIDGNLDSFSGPALFTRLLQTPTNKSDGHAAYTLTWQSRYVSAQISDAGECGVFNLREALGQRLVTDYAAQCMASLPMGNVTVGGKSTRSSIQVDGRNAYLPYSASWIEANSPGPVAQNLTMTVSASADGNGVLTESAALVRCSHDETYEPTSTSCPSFVPTGVTFNRRMLILHGGQQAQVRDSFVSSDGAAHNVALEYTNGVNPAQIGSAGIGFPGHPGGVVPQVPGQTLTGFGSGIATTYLTSNVYAWPNGADTGYAGLTWSRRPSSVLIGNSGAVFGLRYTLAVPPGASDSLGLTVSETTSIPATQALAAAAEAEMMSAPSISSPGNGARVGSQATTVTGAVSAGTNGLPVAVSVNGHPATIAPTSATTATYTVRFALPWGTHPVTVVAVDAGGNQRSSSVTVTNSPALGVRARPRMSRWALVVPVICQRFAPSACVGKVVVRSTRGAVIGSSRAFTVGRGRNGNIGVRIRPGNHTVRVYLYQREPTGAYILVSAKPYRV